MTRSSSTPPGCDASPGLPGIKFTGTQLCISVERDTEESVLSKNTRQSPLSGLDPGPLYLEVSSLTMISTHTHFHNKRLM